MRKAYYPMQRLELFSKSLFQDACHWKRYLKLYLVMKDTFEAAVHNQFGSQVIRIPSSTIDDVFYQVTQDWLISDCACWKFIWGSNKYNIKLPCW